jgi:hypothetical protein
MASTIVARGWQFIRGHKGGAGVVHNKGTHKQPAPRPGPVRAVGMKDVLGFLKEQERVLGEQEAEACEALEKARAYAAELEARLGQLTADRICVHESLNLLAAVPAWRNLWGQ